MLYYIISLLISVVADEILYLFYKWLSKEVARQQHNILPDSCMG